MPVLQDPDMIQLNNPELYNVWKGQLYIHEHLACDINFKSSSTCGIPAQLPSKLEIKEVIRLSELTKALPEQIFDQTDYTGQEACCGDIYYRLYAVKTSNVNGFEFDKLQQWMKCQELALLKGLNDQGFLLLLTSSALKCNKDLCVSDSFQLFALFLFPHTKLLDHTEREDWGFKSVKEDLSLKISELLPGLQYAILETRRMQKGKYIYPDALVKEHFKQFASLQRNNVSACELKAQLSDISSLSSDHGKDTHSKCDQLAFSHLQSYFSSPINFCVPLVKMSSLLKEDVPVSSDSEKCGKKIIVKDSLALESKIPLLAANKIKSDSSSGNNVLNENKKQPTKKRTFKKGERRGSRKGKRNNTHQTALSSSATSENQVLNKKRKLIGGDQQQDVSSNRTTVTTVKLASAPYSHRRKRGAEVLTAEFVNDDKVSEKEAAVTNKSSKEQKPVLKNKVITGKPRKMASAEDIYFVRDRPPRRKVTDAGNRNKLPEVKAKSETMQRAVTKHQEQSGKQFRRMEAINAVPLEPVSTLSKSSTDLKLTTKQSAHAAPVPENDIMEKRISMYESHALNLLADLALNSLSSSSISYINSQSVASISEPVVQESIPDSTNGNTVEYTQNDCLTALQSSTNVEEAVEAPDCVKSQPKMGSDASQVNSTTHHRTENSEKQTSHKVLIAAAKAKARNNSTSKICLEHSYSQLPRDDIADKSAKELNEKPFQSVSEATVTSLDNDVVVNQSSDWFFPRELLVTNDNGYPSFNTEPKEVSKFNFVITFKWDAKYDFDLDSKFTSDPLEKTINRALHGPWNPNLKEKVEDVKIILHMWLALFYSKPSQQLTSSSRKVVEHSNPAKYVSINTVRDPIYENTETYADDSKNGDKSDPLRNYTHTETQIMSDVSPVWHEMRKNYSSSQPVDLSVASKIQTKVNPRESEHRYSKHFSSEEETHKSSGLEKSFSMLHEDTCSTVCKYDESAEDYMSVSPGPMSNAQAETHSLHDGMLSLNADENHRAATRRELMTDESTYVTRSTVNETEVSPSDTLSMNSTTDVFHEDEHSDNSEGTEDFLKQTNIHVNSEQNGTLLEPSDGKDILETKLQDVNEDSAMEQNNEDKELHTSDVHLVIASSNGSKLEGCEENPYQVNDLKSSCFGENQTNVTFYNNEGLSSLSSLNCGSGTAPLEDAKASDCGIHLSDDTPPTTKNPKAAGISVDLVQVEKSSMKGESEDQVTRSMNLLAKSIKEAESSTGIKLNDGLMKDSSDDLELMASSINEAKTSSSTNEDISVERSEQSSDELEECKKEVNLPAINDKHEVPKKLTVSSGYSQENEHSYVSKFAAFVNMGKLELSPSSNETSDIEDMDTDNVEESHTESSTKSVEEKSHSDEIPNLASISEGTVAELHQDDYKRLEDDECKVNRDTVAIQVTYQSIKINETEKTEESLLDSESPFPPCDLGVDTIASLPAVSASFHEKVIEAADSNFLQSDEMENKSEIDQKEDPTDYLQTSFDQEIGPLISEEISGKDTKTCFDEKSLLLCLESSKVADMEHIGEKSSLLGSQFSKISDWEDIEKESLLQGSESIKDVNLESLEENSSLLSSDYIKASDLENVGENSSLLGSESSKAVDLECISVLEKLTFKAVKDMYTSQMTTLAKKLESQFHDVEKFPAEKETMDTNPSVELLNVQNDLSGSCVLDMEDQMIPNKMHTENSCEMLLTPGSESLNRVSSAISLVGKSKFGEITQDSDCATNGQVNKLVDGNVEQLPVEAQSDFTSDAVRLSAHQSGKSTKEQNQRNTIRNEILSKLKRICRGPGIGHHTSSNSEDEVFIVHEKPGKWCTREQKKQTDIKIVDLSKPEMNAVSLAESTNKILENQTPQLEVLEEKWVQEAVENRPIVSSEPVLQEAEQLVSLDDFTDNMDQDPSQDQSDICCILNTGSISKEQYDRWSDTSDEDIEFIQAYKEPRTHKNKYLHREFHESPNSPLEEPTHYLETSHSRKEKHFKLSDQSTSLWEADDYVSRYHRDMDYPSPRSHESFTITKKFKDIGRTWSTIQKESSCSGRSDFGSLFTNRKMVSSDLTQSTLDMEHLRFMCRLKDILRKSSTDIHISEPPFQTMFDSRRIPGCSSSRTKCTSPLLITVHCTHHRKDYRGYDGFPSSSYSQTYYEEELRDRLAYSRNSKKARTHRSSPPYHFNRLRYESTLEKPNSDISVIIKECTQSNHLKLCRVGLGSTIVERPSTCPVPEQTGWQIRQTFDPTSTKSQTVGNIISDLCTNLRTRLQSVARESTQTNCYFYFSKTADEQNSDDDFFSLTKSLLIKDGYTPIEPQDFCDHEQADSKLFVIIRNEDVSSQIHKIPCLLQLRLLPNVTFAGVDTPEDLSESMYQELLQTGGFVVSDKTLLETITMGKLKEVLAVLEKMNRSSPWKWLIHYGEYRKLKEDKRSESVSRIKIPLLKSYQQSNIIEILPYHHCDSRSKDLSSDLECLLSLQRHHIRSRLAVYLTVMPSTETKEFEESGLFVHDVDTFIRGIQKVDAQLQPSS